MAHNTVKIAYSQLAERLNLFPQGAPPSELLYKILHVLFKEKEAGLVALLPIKPFTAQKAAKCWKTDITSAKKTLDELAGRALLIDIEKRGTTWYVLPPPMAGFFEFSLMRIRKDIDQKHLSELFWQYLNVEEDFVRELFAVGETQLGRAFVHEPALSNDNALHVLDYERATEVINTATHLAVGMCYCRHKKQHLGTECDAPMDICMTLNSTAASLSRHGHASAIDKSECMDLLQSAYEHNLVQFGENIQKRVSFICNCCGCCCEAMIAARRFAILNPVHTTNFIPEIDDEQCTGCGKCVSVCPVEAMSLVSANDPQHPKKKSARLNEDICLGCGVCVRACTKGDLKLKSRPERVISPVTGAHRAVLMAIERGKLQNLIFDNQAMTSHRAMAAVLGVILSLPPLKQALANKQIKSRFVDRMLKKRKH